MGLIIKSFILSFSVFGRMILPVFAITVVSTIVWSLLNAITGGYATYLSGSITATFVSLFGIRVALSHLGEYSRTEYEGLILYSVLYGVFLFIAMGVALTLVDIAAILYADWKLGEAISFRNIANAKQSLQLAFAIHAFSAKAIAALVVFTAVQVAMAVPLAGAARAAGHGSMSAGFFNGFGHSFMPLFFIFAVSFFLQFFFDLFTFLFATLPIFLSVISIVFHQTLPDFDPEILFCERWPVVASFLGLGSFSSGACDE